jgi:hypothetical protein
MSFTTVYPVESLSVYFYGNDTNRTIGIRWLDPSANQLSSVETGAPYNLRLYKKDAGATPQAQWTLVPPFNYVSPSNPGLDVNSNFLPSYTAGNIMTFFVDSAGNIYYNNVPTVVASPFNNPGGYLLVVQRNFSDLSFVGNVYSVAASYLSYAPPGQIVPTGPDFIENFAPPYGSYNLFSIDLNYTWQVNNSFGSPIVIPGETSNSINSTTYEQTYTGLGQAAFISNTIYNFTAPIPFIEVLNPIDSIVGNPILTVPTDPYDVNLCFKRTNFPPPPWARFSLICNTDADNEFTAEQLQMRRKAEILQYYNNKVNMQKSTKAQQWSFIARGLSSLKNTYATQTVNFTNPNTTNFPNNNRIIALSSQCTNNVLRVSTFPSYCSDVPGPVVPLTFDPRVPLVRFKRVYTYPTVNQPATSDQVNSG